jgi:hypothetical protein
MNTTKRDPDGRIISRRYDDPEAKVFIEGYGYFAEYEAEEARQQYEADCEKQDKRVRENWLATERGRACAELYEKFQQYKTMMKKTPYVYGRGDGKPVDFPEHVLFSAALEEYEQTRAEQAEIARRNLEKARQAERCEHRYLDGERCGSPKMKGKKLCYTHRKLEQVTAEKFDLGSLEDADSIQLAIKKLLAAVIDGKVDPKQIGYISNLLSVAAWNVKNTSTATRYTAEEQ